MHSLATFKKLNDKAVEEHNAKKGSTPAPTPSQGSGSAPKPNEQ